MKIVVLGLTLSSSWGNGHATTYRALLRALGRRGHDILFLECDRPWYAVSRDLVRPDYCRLEFYDDPAELVAWRCEIVAADLVILGSYVVNGIETARCLRPHARRLAFYDIDTPVTLAALERGDCAYLEPALIPTFDHYFSFTGGPTLHHLARHYGARHPQALYCAADPELYRPLPAAPTRWDLGYLGTYSSDRQPALESLLLEPARRRPDLKFVVAGPQYPAEIDWPVNVARIEHLRPADHVSFYAACRLTLNLTRADMIAAGYSPSVRLFEAGACAAAIISDRWPGIDTIFTPGREILIADDTRDILGALDRSGPVLARIGRNARARVLHEHTAAHRAGTIEAALQTIPLAMPANRGYAEADLARTGTG